MKLCSGLLKFKRSDSKAGKRVCPKQLTFCLDYLSLTTEGNCSEMFATKLEI